MDKYVSLRDGTPYPDDLPKVVSTPVSKWEGEKRITRVITAQSGSEEYDRVLEAWMFSKGYIHAK